MTNADREDTPQIVTYRGQVCVEAGTATEAEEKARQWGMRHLSETVAVSPGTSVVQPCDAGQLAVPLTGTMNVLAASQAAADAHVRDLIAGLRNQGTLLGVTVGAFTVGGEPPHPAV